MNSILWGNTASISGAQVYNAGLNHPNIYYCDVQGGSAGIGLISGTYSGIYQNNINADPHFVTDVPSPAPSAGGDLHLLNDYPTNSSPCFEAGNNDYLEFGPTTDFDGENRIQVEHVDMGAYEGGNYSTSPIIYVDINASGNNDGITWTNAFTDLQWAMLIARTCPGFTTIEVAAGTYKPTDGTDRYISFEMINGISIMGGYPTGGGTRNWETNETILSGDLSSNDDFDISYYGGSSIWAYLNSTGNDNSYHVVYNDITLTQTGILDGFTIKGGNANKVDGLEHITDGAGMYNNQASPTINNCTFVNNAAYLYGAGMYNYEASPVITNSVFSENFSFRGDGAGVCSFSNISTTISGCVFSGNRAGDGGPGLSVGGGSLTLSNSTFSNNLTADSPYHDGQNLGGALFMWGISNSSTITNCSFTGNDATRAGAVYIDDASGTIINNSIFTGNHAYVNGGAIAFYTGTQNTEVINCTFAGNSADIHGGALYFIENDVSIKNSILWGNSAPSGAQVVFSLAEANIHFYNSDIQDGTAAFGFASGGTYTGNYVNNIDADPLFVDALNEDLRLYGNSPSVNYGENSFNSTSTDLRGQARIQNTTIDMGAYEWTAGVDPAFRIIYVNQLAGGLNNGNSWDDAYTSLQSALDIATSGSQIWVAKGTYNPSYDYGLMGGSHLFHFRLIEGVEIYGGFAGTETAASQRTNFGLGEANETILSGDLSGDDVFDISNGGYQGTTGMDNCAHVLYHPDGLNLTSATILDGFTITGGNANGPDDPNTKAGGLYLFSSSPTIRNIVFHSNQADNLGGGAYIYNSTSVFTNISFTENISGGGGALYINYASPVLNNCIFTGNVSSGDGGALSTHSSSPTLTNALFSSNTAGNNGGAIIFYSNSVQFDAILNNVTFSDNQAGVSGGAIRFASNNAASDLNINNCIIWGNTAATSGNELSLVSTGTTIINYSYYKNSTNDVQVSSGTLTATNNNINSNPFFVNAAGNDFRITGESPCADAGNDSYCSESNDIRGAGFARKLNKTTGNAGTIDMGAYEYKLGDDPLPVELISFTANVNENNVELTWQTATEANNYGFEVERIFDPPLPFGHPLPGGELKEWKMIGFVEGHGNSNSPKDYSFIDAPTSDKIESSSISYRLKQIDTDGRFEYSEIVSVEMISQLPTHFELFQNYPNPFNPTTTIKFGLPKDSHVTLAMFNILGEKVATLIDKGMSAGYHNYQLSIDNYQLTSGMYIYRIKAGEFVQIKKLLLLK